jgi:hypothetical protein
MQSIYVDNIKLIRNMLNFSIDAIEFISNMQSISSINTCLVIRLKMQVDCVFICFFCHSSELRYSRADPLI